MDFSKVFADHDETLLYILFYTMCDEEIQYMSSQELRKKGWIYNDVDQTWCTTRERTSKSGKDSKSKSRSNYKGEDNELQRYKFDIDQWNLVELNSSENSK